jgi:glutamine amidotransferase
MTIPAKSDSRVTIVDCGIANLGSISKVIGTLVSEYRIARKPEELKDADKIILPGVGAFPEAMRRLNQTGLAEAITDISADSKVLILGICLGMQLLATVGEEHTESSGLNLIQGRVIKIKASRENLRIPHVGWNSVKHDGNTALLRDIPSETDFYFVHSYVFQPALPEVTIGRTEYSEVFTSVVNEGRVYGTQFHPEKSSTAGRLLLRNFVDLPNA